VTAALLNFSLKEANPPKLLADGVGQRAAGLAAALGRPGSSSRRLWFQYLGRIVEDPPEAFLISPSRARRAIRCRE